MMVWIALFFRNPIFIATWAALKELRVPFKMKTTVWALIPQEVVVLLAVTDKQQ
ncbi:hypothetical protein ACMXYO_08640 [Neptuniibacter sp. QD37_6]|uniref:hypothetical protein n=1 Tax=Neptuniibacter sp. QD37_6 TaxID=3398210 RepID=UPI0039F5DB5C